MIIVKTILTLILCFNISFANKSFDKIIQKEDDDQDIKKINVQRGLRDRDVVIIGQFTANTFENLVMANEIRKEMKALIFEKPNLMPILQEDASDIELPKFITDYEALKAKDVAYVINGRLDFKDAEFKLHLLIFDIFKGEKVAESEFKFKKEYKELFVKQVSTQIYEFLTGEFGFFYGKLLYTATNRPGVKPFKRVIISHRENDLIEATAFTNGVDITFNPRYCSKNQEVVFVSQQPRKGAEIFIANRITGQIQKLPINILNESSIFSPSISNDCNKLALSISGNGSTNIYIYDREQDILQKITATNNAINTAPEFFDNDKKIVFVSDRTGKPKIWTMTADGQNQKMITKGEGAYYSPSVSQDGSKIAFINVKSGIFSLGNINTDGTNEEVLYSSFLIENPTWTPIGKTILFSMKKNRDDKSRIYYISLNGREPEELDALKGNLAEPRWIDEF
jgi:TolB protein